MQTEPTEHPGQGNTAQFFRGKAAGLSVQEKAGRVLSHNGENKES